MPARDYRRVEPLYWFRDYHGEPFHSGRFGHPGSNAFCFFSTVAFAQGFLRKWLEGARSVLPGGRNPMNREIVSRDDWGIHCSDDADRLLSLCDEVAQVQDKRGPEGFRIDVPYDYFFVDPPTDPNSAALPKDLETMKAEIKERAKRGLSWQQDL